MILKCHIQLSMSWGMRNCEIDLSEIHLNSQLK